MITSPESSIYIGKINDSEYYLACITFGEDIKNKEQLITYAKILIRSMSESAITWWANLTLEQDQIYKNSGAYNAAIECLKKVNSKEVNLLSGV